MTDKKVKPTIGMRFSKVANMWIVYQNFNTLNETDHNDWYFTKLEAEQKLKELIFDNSLKKV